MPLACEIYNGRIPCRGACELTTISVLLHVYVLRGVCSARRSQSAEPVQRRCASFQRLYFICSVRYVFLQFMPRAHIDRLLVSGHVGENTAAIAEPISVTATWFSVRGLKE